MGSKERREREKVERRALILNSARELLFEKGLNATTVNQIARISELSVGSIYSYFNSKEEIFAALQEEGLDILCEMISKVQNEDLSPGEKLKMISRAYMEFSEKHKNYFDIINYFLSSPEMIFPDNLKYQIDKHGDMILSVLDKVIMDGVDDNVFVSDRPRENSLMLWSLIHGLIQFKKLKATVLDGIDYESLYEKSVDQYIKSLEIR